MTPPTPENHGTVDGHVVDHTHLHTEREALSYIATALSNYGDGPDLCDSIEHAADSLERIAVALERIAAQLSAR